MLKSHFFKKSVWFRNDWFLSYLNFWAEMIKWKRKKYRTSDGSYDRMLKKKWDAALETGLESGIFKHDHKGRFQILKFRFFYWDNFWFRYSWEKVGKSSKGHQVKDFPGERGWVGVYCPARIAAKRPSPSFDSGKLTIWITSNTVKAKCDI